MLIVVMGLFLITPFLKTRKSQIVILSILVGFIAIVLIFPSSILMDINVPILNSSISDITLSFVGKNTHYQNLIEFDASVEANLLTMVTRIVKGVIVLVVLGLTLLISSLVLCIVSLCKKKEKKFKVCLSTLVLAILSFVMLLSPVYSISTLYTTVNRNLGKKNSTLIETYPEYKEYEKIFSLLDGVSEAIDFELGIFDALGYPLDALSLGSYSSLNSDLASVDKHLGMLKTSGITVIYTDENFDFYNINKKTFDFDKIIELINAVEDSELYSDMAMNYVNRILKSVEEKIETSSNKGDFNLQLTKEEFEKEYKGLLELLEFVVKYDLVKSLKNITVSSLAELVLKLTNDGLKIPAFNLIIVNKIKNYMGYNTNLAAALYTCSKLYDALNIWLSEYKETNFYTTSYEFLQARGVI